MKKVLLVLICMLFAAAGQVFAQGANDSGEGDVDMVEYSFLTVFDESPDFGFNNPEDTVTPIVEEMQGVKVGEVLFSAGMSPMERINMLVAAGNLPDVVRIDVQNIISAYETGAFADLTPYIDSMPNLDKYISDAGWNRLTYDGKVIAITANMSGGRIDLENPEVAEEVSGDVYFNPPMNWALVANENILRQAGYTFKSVAELQAELDENPRTLTEEDYAIYPPLETVGDFEELLYRIQELGLEVNGQDIIPLSVPDWAAYHMSILFAPTGGWCADPETGEISGYLNNPGMKDFYVAWKKWFSDGLLDKDYLIHKGDQFQEKVASSRTALTFPGGIDINACRQSLKDEDPNNDLRPIPWPASTAGNTIDPSHPGGWEVFMFNKDFADIEKVVEYFDWFQTGEAQDLFCWGPESNGIWEVVDGKKVFIDDALWEAIRDGGETAEGKNGLSYGIENVNKDNFLEPSSRAYLAGPDFLYNKASVVRSYPVKLDAYNALWISVTKDKLNFDGTVLPPMGVEANFVGGYYWGTARTTKIAELLVTKSEAEFNAVWQKIIKDFELNGHYSAGVKDMEVPFAQSLGK